MSKIFDIDFRNGSLVDKVSGGVAINSPGGKLEKTNIGYAFAPTSTSICGISKNYNVYNFSIFFVCRKNSINGSEGVIGYSLTPTHNSVYFINNVLRLETNNNGDYIMTSVISTDTRWHHYAIICTNGVFTVYKDMNAISLTDSTIIDYTLRINNIGRFSTGYVKNIAYVRMFDHPITIAEMQKDYNDYLNFKPLGIAKTNFIKYKPTEVRENGLIAAYNMIPQKGVLYDISGNGRNGTIVGAVSSKDGTQFDGVNDYVNLTSVNLGTTYTINFRIKPTVNKNLNAVIGNSSTTTNFILISEAGQVIHRASSPSGDIVNGTGIFPGSWHNVSIVRNGTVSVSIYIDGKKYTNSFANNTDYVYRYVGRLVNDYGNHNMQDLKIYNRALSEQEILKYHNDNIRTTLLEDWENNGADGLTTLPKGWTRASGAFKVGENITNEISGRKIGDKYVECVTAGLMSIGSKIAYGTWEFDWYKASSSNILYFHFIAEKKQIGALYLGYQISIQTAINLRENETALFSTAASYIEQLTWYRIKITRNNVSTFTVYIKGGLFGSEWVLVSASTGTNPVTDVTYTTSNFINLDLDAGDRVGEVDVKDGICMSNC